MSRTVEDADVVRAEESLRRLRHGYLRRFGWEHTCDTPGSLWLWRRDFRDLDRDRREWRSASPGRPVPAPYGVLAVSEDAAVQITRSVLDRDYEREEHPC